MQDAAERHALQSPALLIVGEVAALAKTLAWFGAEPVVDEIGTVRRSRSKAAA